jgi:hypothetical protein
LIGGKDLIQILTDWNERSFTKDCADKSDTKKAIMIAFSFLTELLPQKAISSIKTRYPPLENSWVYKLLPTINPLIHGHVSHDALFALERDHAIQTFVSNSRSLKNL